MGPKDSPLKKKRMESTRRAVPKNSRAKEAPFNLSQKDGLDRIHRIFDMLDAFDLATAGTRTEKELVKTACGVLSNKGVYQKIRVELFGTEGRKSAHGASKAAPGKKRVPKTISYPLKSGKAVLGRLNLSTGEPDGISALERRILSRISSDLAKGIAAIRERAEQERIRTGLETERRKFQLIADFTSDWEYWIDPSGRFQYVSPSCEGITGYPPETFYKDPNLLLKIIHPEDGRLLQKPVNAALKRRNSASLDFRIVTRKGDVRWISHRCKPVFDERGKWMGMWSSNRDITERKRADEALKKSNQLLNDIGEMAKVGGWELDLSTKEVSWTEETCRIHGVRPGYSPKLEEALSFYASESRPALEAVLKKAAETGEPYDLEGLFIPSCGKNKIWVRSLGKAVYSGGKIVKLTGTFQNIDKYKRAEEALRENEEKLRSVIKYSVDGIVIADERGAIVEWNRGQERLTGLKRSDMLGKPVWQTLFQVTPEDHQSPEVIETLRSKTLEFLKSGKAEWLYRLQEREIRRPDGSRAYVQAMMSPVKTARGWISVGITRDITKRRRFEAEIQENRSQLQMLMQRLNVVQESERRKISRELHDEIGQSLTAIKINLSEMEKEARSECGPAGRERLAETEAMVDRMLEQIHEMSLDLRPSMLDDLGLVPTIQWYTRQYARRLHIDLKLETGGLSARMDPELETDLYRIIQEALTNVAKHAHATKVLVRMRQNASVFKIVIADNGKGFEMNEAKNIPIGARGIGLIGIRERIASHQGHLKIESALGSGFKLAITIPRKEGNHG
jgi:PAS domain S-box-containing protein